MDPELESALMQQALMDPRFGGQGDESELMQQALMAPQFSSMPVRATPPRGMPTPVRSPRPAGPPMAAPMAQPQARPAPMAQPQTLNLISIPYAVRKGDSISVIARRNNTTVTQLKKLNPEIKNIDRIFPGQEIRLPMPATMGEFSAPAQPDSFTGSPLMDELSGKMIQSEYWRDRAWSPDRDAIMKQDLMMGMMAGAPMLGAIAPAVGGAVTGGLGSLARMMPPALPPAGRVAMPMSKGAVDWPGAAKTFSNVRPLNIPVGAERAMGASAQEALMHARNRIGPPKLGDPYPSNPLELIRYLLK